MKKLFLLIFALSLFSTLTCEAQNPYMPLWEFIPDGEPYVFEDPDQPGKYRVYVYGSHDNLIQNYCGRDQVVWSAPVENLKDWRYDGIIFESKKDANGKWLNPIGKNPKKAKDGVGDVLYAPDVVEKVEADGKKTYYLYPNVQHDDRNNLVAKSDRPDGPFTVCNWNPEKPQETVGPFAFDPAAFIDDDGRAYGYWGFEFSNAAELDPETMATVKPGTYIVKNMIPGRAHDQVFRFFEASSIRKIKDKYVFIYSRWTNNGEFGLPESNYTLAYCYSNNPLGPWTYGGTIIDGRGREQRPDGTTVATACPNGNTHGSICFIPSPKGKTENKGQKGDWWVFYHRQAGTTEYSRQAMVAPINVEVREGIDGYVRISEAEFTSEGFMTEGLDPYTPYAAGIACYFTGPEPAHAEYPNVIYPGSHTEIYRLSAAETPAPKTGDYFNPAINRCSMVNNTNGSVVGYKYYNFSQTFKKDSLQLVLNLDAEGVEGRVEIYLDRPSEDEGGVKIGSYKFDGSTTTAQDVTIPVNKLKHYNGKHALFLVFKSKEKNKSLCKLNTLVFS